VIRINLLGVERKAKKAIAFDVTQQLTLLCSLVIVVAALLIGWWYWSLNQASAQVDIEIAAAQQEAQRLQSLLAEVKQFEGRRAQLRQRVSLIEQLRSGQSVPVQMLDHVSRSLPDMLWLTEMQQDGTTLMLSGQSTTLISLSDFVGNLGRSSLLKKPIEIVESQVEAVAGQGTRSAPPVELITFQVKAEMEMPAGATPTGKAGSKPAVKTH
jgi:type IV pilus assembly protein PilN